MRTSKQQVEEIRRLAADALRDHALYLKDGGYWRCAKDGTSAYSFQIFFAPGVVAVWGDLGEYTLCHYDRDSLAWLLRATKNGEYPDYFLGKLQALSGDKEEFFYGDAMEHLAELDQDGSSRTRTSIALVRRALNDVKDDGAKEQERAWWEVWSSLGDSDPNPCTGWASGPLWLWEMACTFRRLYEAQIEIERLASAVRAGLARRSF